MLRNRPRQVAARAARREIARTESQRVIHGIVTAIDEDAVPPTTVAVGPASHPAYANDTVEYAVGDKVSLSFNGRTYTIIGRIDPMHHGTPAMGHRVHDLIATYVGDGTLTTMIFGGGVGVGNALDPDGNLLTEIPQDFNHLLLEGRLSHTGNVVSGLVEAKLRFNADTGTDYYYSNWNSQGSSFVASASLSQDRVFVNVGTVGTVRCYLPHYRAPSAILSFTVKADAAFGTAVAANFDQRSLGGRYEIGLGVPLTEIRLFVTGGEFWEDTTHVTLYGMM